jgi:hypothetical protein
VRPRTFFALNVGGTLIRLVIVWALGQQFREPLEGVVAFVQRYQWWLVGGLFAASMVQSARRAARGQIESPTQAEAEIEAEWRAEHDAAASVRPSDDRPA